MMSSLNDKAEQPPVSASDLQSGDKSSVRAVSVVLVFADAVAGLVALVWLYLFREMVAHYAALPAYGYSGTWDFWVYFPLAIFLGLIASMAVFTFALRRPAILALIAGVALFLILPYGMMIGGGV